MKILFIGGTGEISYECVKVAAAQGHTVTVFNRGLNPEPLPAGVRRITGALEDPAAYGRLGDERFDVVCQFKAYDRAEIERDSAVFGGKTGQYVFISTASAYRKPPLTHLITENVPLANPYWPYSAAKAEMEAVLMQWHAAGKLRVTIVRPNHTYRRRFPGTFVPGDVHAWRMLHGRPVIIHEPACLWVLTHASDFAAPFVGLLGKRAALGEAFHITTDEVHTWADIYRTIGEALGVEPQFVSVPTQTLLQYNPEWTGPLMGDKSWPAIFDNRKVKSVAGDFTCRVKLAVGMKSVVPHYHERAKEMPVDEKLNALLDRIAQEQSGLGTLEGRAPARP